MQNERVTDDEHAEFDRIATELLSVRPSRFVDARNARADAVGAELGRRIRTLRKPTLAAWATNLLSHDDTFHEAMTLADALRDAQDDLDRTELSRLGGQRRQLVAALARRAVELAARVDVTVGAGARDEVERTINAAIVEPVAGAVVAAGRLVRPLDPGALDTDSLAASVAGSVPGVEARPEPDRDDLAERRARREAERARREAEQAVSAAQRELTRIDAQIEKARARADLLHERVDDLRRDLARVSSDAESADDALAELETQRRDRASAVESASHALDRAARRAGA